MRSKSAAAAAAASARNDSHVTAKVDGQSDHRERQTCTQSTKRPPPHPTKMKRKHSSGQAD